MLRILVPPHSPSPMGSSLLRAIPDIYLVLARLPCLLAIHFIETSPNAAAAEPDILRERKLDEMGFRETANSQWSCRSAGLVERWKGETAPSEMNAYRSSPSSFQPPAYPSAPQYRFIVELARRELGLAALFLVSRFSLSSAPTRIPCMHAAHRWRECIHSRLELGVWSRERWVTSRSE
jgi:hypothetical protein